MDETTTQELIEELQSRSLCSVVIYIMPDDNSTCITNIWTHGNRCTQLGMIKYVEKQLLESMKHE